MAFLDQLAGAVIPHPSAWRLASAGSSSGSLGLEKFLYVAVTGGTLYMAMGDGSRKIPYQYSGVGVGGGVGLSVLGPVGGSFSAASFASSGGEWGRLHLAPSMLGRSELDADSIIGPAFLINISGSLIGGVSVSLVFFGVYSCSDFVSPFGMMNRAKAVAFQAGLEVTTTYGAGVTGYQLNIFNRGKME